MRQEGRSSQRGVVLPQKGTRGADRPPVETIQRGVDTQELAQELSKMTVATQTGSDLAGRGERGRSLVEAGMVDIKGEVT